MFVAEQKKTPESATPNGFGGKKGDAQKEPTRRRSSGSNIGKYAVGDMDDRQRADEIKKLDRSKDGKMRSSTKLESFSEKAFGPDGEEADESNSRKQYSKRRGS